MGLTVLDALEVSLSSSFGGLTAGSKSKLRWTYYMHERDHQNVQDDIQSAILTVLL